MIRRTPPQTQSESESQPDQPPAAAPALLSRVSLRAVLIGCVLIVLNSAWVSEMEAVKAGMRTSTYSLFFVAVFDLIVLNLGSRILARVRPAWALTPAELIAIYVMMNVGVALVGIDLLQVIVTIAGFPAGAPNHIPNVDGGIVTRLPGWLVVKDIPTATDMATGGGSFWTARHLGHWAPVIAGWTALLMTLMCVMLCLNLLLRDAWMKNERLAFPMVILPLEIVRPDTRLWSSPAMWTGFGVAAVVIVVDALHAAVPGVPEIPIAARDACRWIPDPPWNALGDTPLCGFPWAFGLGFLLPADIVFSGVFFFWLWKIIRVAMCAYGMLDTKPDAPYINEHTLGGYIGLCIVAIYHARHALTSGLIRRSAAVSPDLKLRRTATIVGGIGSAVLIVMGVAAGLSPLLAVLFMGMYLAVSITITRIRAEFGAPVHDFSADPGGTMVQVAGTTAFGARELGAFTVLFGFTRIERGNLMPMQLEGFKMAESTGMDYVSLCPAILIAGLVGTLAGFAALLTPYYAMGTDSAQILGPHTIFENDSYGRLLSWLQQGSQPSADSLNAIVRGLIIVLALSYLRSRWIGFPFHPIGFAVGGSWTMGLLWLPLFVAWIAKVTILRYGGLELYRKSLPFFLGLIIGDFTATSIVNLLAMVFNWPVYGTFAP